MATVNEERAPYPGAQAQGERRDRSSKVVPFIVGCALFMQMLDSTVIATALPTMARDLGETPVRLNLAITSYMLSAAIFIPVSGWVADRFGPRGVFRAAIALFTVSSVLCALSHSLMELVGARILQGAAGAMMVPVGRILLLRTVPKAELVQAMAYVTVPALLGPLLGPPIGGAIVTYGTWPWIFLMNLPIGVAGIVLVSIFIARTGPAERRPFDLPGFVLLAVALAALMFAFDAVARSDLPVAVDLAFFGIGALCTLVYVRHARRTEHALIALDIVAVPSFAASTLGGSLFRLSLGATPFLLALLFQVGFGLSPLHSGLLIFASALGALVMKPCAPPILKRFGFRNVLIWNAVIGSTGMAVYALFGPDTPYALILAVLLATGFFRSLQMTSLNALAFADIAPDAMSRASTLSSMMMQLSLSVGAGLAAVLVHLAQQLNDTAQVGSGEVAPAFLAIGALGAISALFFLRLPPDVGDALSPGRQQAG
ncbi:MAG: DHA2 family efflux MFS transporter permease subunit [Alphaproteobacteria bacterium]|nr:DHA2 family efflux MFS transporter permease subunit [Alphaproteobacteria bacterium]